MTSATDAGRAMTMPAGAVLLLPLRRLPLHPVPLLDRQVLRLDPTGGVGRWAATVRASEEACLLLDADGRVVALSAPAADLLDLRPDAATGALLAEQLSFVDFSLAALPTPEASGDIPPLRALRSGGLARGLVRRRRTSGALTTYDVVGVALAGRTGALAFLVEV